MDTEKIFWETKWQNNDSPWDVGTITIPIKNYIDQLKNKDLKILVPGCGNAYEAEYLIQQGFTNVYVMDISESALKGFEKRAPNFKKSHLLLDDFFKHKGQYDLIIEQTFFCAIPPALRSNYAVQAAQLLKPGGKLVGVLFNDVLNTTHPPYGGNAAEYKIYFENFFNFKTFETCYNSIKPRAGRELFINFTKK